MSQRNPMNERYTRDDHKGVARKSAASAKPKAKAASSVTVVSSKKTPQQKKAEAKAERRKEEQRRSELNRKYYKPDTPAYKRYRKMWWACLILAVACVAGSWFLRGVVPEPMLIAVLVLAYVFIIAAFVIDFWKIRKERTAYQERMVAKEESESKKARAEARRAMTKAKAQASQAKGDDAAQQTDAEDAQAEKPKRFALFGKKKAQE